MTKFCIDIKENAKPTPTKPLDNINVIESNATAEMSEPTANKTRPSIMFSIQPFFTIKYPTKIEEAAKQNISIEMGKPNTIFSDKPNIGPSTKSFISTGMNAEEI